MTSITRNGKRVQMSIQAKAKLLTVVDIHENGVLAVISGSNPTKGYAVRHDGTHATYCPCEAHCKCAHMYAAERRLAEMYREQFPNDFYFAA